MMEQNRSEKIEELRKVMRDILKNVMQKDKALNELLEDSTLTVMIGHKNIAIKNAEIILFHIVPQSKRLYSIFTGKGESTTDDDATGSETRQHSEKGRKSVDESGQYLQRELRKLAVSGSPFDEPAYDKPKKILSVKIQSTSATKSPDDEIHNESENATSTNESPSESKDVITSRSFAYNDPFDSISAGKVIFSEPVDLVNTTTYIQVKDYISSNENSYAKSTDSTNKIIGDTSNLTDTSIPNEET